MSGMKIREMLKPGGKWLGTARSHLQRTPRGDGLIWGSQMPVSITVAQIEEMALDVAAAAVAEDRERVTVELRKPSFEREPPHCATCECECGGVMESSAKGGEEHG